MNNRDRYPPEWQDIIRPDALRRAGYRCSKCKATHRSWGYYDASDNYIECDDFMKLWAKRQGIRVQKIHLQVAHLDHNPQNCTESNLRVFCPRHHLEYDRPVNLLKRLATVRKPPGTTIGLS